MSISEAVTVVMLTRFAVVLTTDEWLACLAGGGQPERETIFGSNQLGRKLGS